MGVMMSTAFRELLATARTTASNHRQKGTYFERLTQIWLKHAPTQAGIYSRVLTFAEFAHERGETQVDTGIDLVAQLADHPDQWCAVQCKFYAEGFRIGRPEIDSFIADSSRPPFVRRIFVDTTGVNWTQHAEDTFRSQS